MSFVWEIGHSDLYGDHPGQFCVPGQTFCGSFNFDNWAGFQPIRIFDATFGDGSHPQNWAVVSDTGGKAEVLGNSFVGPTDCTAYGGPFCIYPWFSSDGGALNYGVNHPNTVDNFGEADQFRADGNVSGGRHLLRPDLLRHDHQVAESEEADTGRCPPPPPRQFRPSIPALAAPLRLRRRRWSWSSSIAWRTFMREPDPSRGQAGKHCSGLVGGIVELAPRVGDVAGDDREAVVRLDQYRLMPRRVSRCRDDAKSRQNLLFALELHVRGALEVDPLRKRVVLCASRLTLEPLHVDRRPGEEAVPTAVVEMQVCIDYANDITRDGV
jgi:hypothetical protein